MTSTMTTDPQPNASCLVERVESLSLKSIASTTKSTRRLSSIRGSQRLGGSTRQTSRQSLKFCAKNFVTKWSEDLEQHYRMGDLLGEGGYGHVYSCTCLSSGAERAVKVVLKSSDVIQNQMVIREFEVLKELDHPNILKNYALFETESHFYIVTDWIKGGELFDLLEQEFTEEEVRTLMKALLSCMNYVHQQHIVHRDLKPENILLEQNRDFSTIKVIDFGLAQFFQGEGGSFTEAAGSKYYISPQVIEGQYTCKCDIWSCGIIAYVCLGGYAPWEGEDDIETAQLILDADQVYFDDPAWDDFSESALDFIEYLLSFDETKRPTAAQALQHEWLHKDAKALSTEDQSKIEGSARMSLESLRSFHCHAADSKLKQCTYSLIASQIVRHEEKEQVDRVFQMLDVDCDGKIGAQDMQSIYNDQFGVDLTEDDIAALIYEVNLSGSGSITYSEFVIASLKEKGQLVCPHNLELAFQMMDKSQTGYLTAQDLITVLGVPEDMEDYVSQRIIAPADIDGDGQISLEEFKAYIAADGVGSPQVLTARRRRRSTMRRSLRVSALLSEPGLADEYGDSLGSLSGSVFGSSMASSALGVSSIISDANGSALGSSISEEPSFKSLLNIFEGQVKENSAVPSLFRQQQQMTRSCT